MKTLRLLPLLLLSACAGLNGTTLSINHKIGDGKASISVSDAGIFAGYMLGARPVLPALKGLSK